MKSRVCYFVFVIVLSTALSVRAAGASEKPVNQPIGIFTDDDGKRIVAGIGATKPLTTLDVSRGEVKLGSAGAACVAALAGTIRYADRKLRLCDSAGWRNVSLDKTQ